jgi:hypothetical protein
VTLYSDLAVTSIAARPALLASRNASSARIP